MGFIKYELKNCKLLDMETGKEILVFDARAVKERTERSGWAGTGIASGGHSWGIATAVQFDFEVGNHAVLVGVNKYLIVSKHPITQKRLGERFVKTKPIETFLELE